LSHTPGPWLIATSNSFRRIVSRDHGGVCEPITQNDGHPDLHFRNGGPEGPDARLLAAAPDLLAALKAVLDIGYERDNELQFARDVIAKAEERLSGFSQP
jgi:hypothetical protein